MVLENCNHTYYYEESVDMCVHCINICRPQSTPVEACWTFCEEYLAPTIATATDNGSLSLAYIVGPIVLLLALLLSGLLWYRIRKFKRKQNRYPDAQRDETAESGASEEMQLVSPSSSDSTRVCADDEANPLNQTLGGLRESSHEEQGDLYERSQMVGRSVSSCLIESSSQPPVSLYSNPALNRRSRQECTPEDSCSGSITCISQPPTCHSPVHATSPSLPLTSEMSLPYGTVSWPPIEDKVYGYLDRAMKEQWVKLVLFSGGILTVFVNTTTSLNEAKSRILENNKSCLSDAQLKVFKMLKDPVIRKLHGKGSIVAGGTTYFSSYSSTISCFLHCDCATRPQESRCANPERVLMVITAHNSAVGTRYYADDKGTQYIGRCVAVFLTDECDIAFVEVCDEFRQKSCNLLKVLVGNTTLSYVPHLSGEDIGTLAQNKSPVMRHGRQPSAKGRFGTIRQENNKYCIIIPDEKPDGNDFNFCIPGDSGSLITSWSKDDVHVKAHAILIGSMRFSYQREDGTEVSQTLGIVSDLSDGIQRLKNLEGDELHNYTLDVQEPFHDVRVTSKGSTKNSITDSGYRSPPQSDMLTTSMSVYSLAPRQT